MDAVLQLKDVHVTYPLKGGGTHYVLERLNLEIEEGEFVCVAGQTGCGKSTLLRLVLGAQMPTQGRMLLDAEQIHGPDRHRGYVPQKYSLFPDKTVLENITFGPMVEHFRPWNVLQPSFWRQRHLVRAEAMEWLKRVGLKERDADKYPDQLSGGMQQRVAIAQALIMQPRILLMDEAFSALDPKTRSDMQRMVRQIWAETQTTILFVTHNLAEAVYLGSRVIVLGKDSPEKGARVVLDLAINPAIRDEKGFPRQEALAHAIRQIEDAAMGGQIEQEWAEFGG